MNDANGTPHGATISSFAPVALYPLPLVTFSVRKPSRLAEALHANKIANPDAVHGIVNILAEHQSEISTMFSRPDLYADPFLSTPYYREDGMPVLKETVGALACSILTSLPMTEDVFKNFGITSDDPKGALDTERNASELFVARVIRVFTSHVASQDNLSGARRPLVYHDGVYSTVS